MTSGSSCKIKGLTAIQFTDKWLVFVLIFLVCFVQLSFCKIQLDISTPVQEKVNFDVKPGGEVNTYTKDWDGFICTFKYACQGGTKEQWEMSLKRCHKKKHFKCIVSRPDGKSYLYFQEFSVSIKGPQLMVVHLFANDNKFVGRDEYNVDREKNTVHHVAGKFKSELTLIGLYAVQEKKKKKKKKEL